MAKEPCAKSCKGQFDPASPEGYAVTRAAVCLVAPKFYAKAEM